MPEYARVCQSMPEYARVCQSMPEYARVFQGMPEYARVCQNMPEYVSLCQSMPEYAKVFPEKLNFSDTPSEKKTLLPSVIHGIIPEICYIIIHKKGTPGGRTITLGGRTLESSL